MVMKRISKLLLFSILISLILTTVVSAAPLRITASPSQNGIVFRWDTDIPVDVYIDGINMVNGTTENNWYVSYLHPDEAHGILLRASVNQTTIGTLEARTLYPQWIIIFMIVVLIVMFILMIFLMKNPIITILIGLISIALALYAGDLASGYGGLRIVPYIFAILAGLFILIALWDLIIEKTQWG
jgi:hypothetical protein